MFMIKEDPNKLCKSLYVMLKIIAVDVEQKAMCIIYGILILTE